MSRIPYDRKGGGGGGSVGGSAVRLSDEHMVPLLAAEGGNVAPADAKRISIAASIKAAFVFIVTFQRLCVVF
jgi:hypothetical protein